jgi:hypothetical protein
LGSIGIVDRVDIPEVIKSGELAALAALPDIHKVVSWGYQLKRKLSRTIHPK